MTLLAAGVCIFAPLATAGDDTGVPIIRNYVLRHRHWHSRDFEIRREADSGSLRVYHIVNYDDYKRHFRNEREVFETGAGKSFLIYFDPRRQVVVKEMYFQ